MIRTLIKIAVIATILALTSCATTEVCTNRHQFTTKHGVTTVKHGAYFEVRKNKTVLKHFENSDIIHNEKCKIVNDTIILTHYINGVVITHKFYNE